MHRLRKATLVFLAVAFAHPAIACEPLYAPILFSGKSTILSKRSGQLLKTVADNLYEKHLVVTWYGSTGDKLVQARANAVIAQLTSGGLDRRNLSIVHGEGGPPSLPWGQGRITNAVTIKAVEGCG